MSIFSPNIDFCIVVFLILLIIFIIFRGTIKPVIEYKRNLKKNNKLIRVLSVCAMVIEISILAIICWTVGRYIYNFYNDQKPEIVNGTIKETTKVGNIDFTVNSIKKEDKICGNIGNDNKCLSWLKLENDYYLVVNITVKNNDDETYIELSTNYNLKNLKNKSYLSEVIFDLRDNPTMEYSYYIKPGESITKEVIFDVNNSDKYYFVFENYHANTDVKYTILKKDIK